MSEPTIEEQIAAANAYEAFMVPALFGEWAVQVANAARIGPGERVLDVACGTGVLTREVASRTGRDGVVVGLDPSPGMLEVARQLAPDVEWQQGVAESMPFPDESFDAVVSQFGLMFFNDRGKAIAEMVRSLAPAGRVAVAVWNSLDELPAYATEVALLERLAGQRAADAVRAPFVLGDSRRLGALFADTGLTSVEILTQRGTANFPSIRLMVEADVRGWLPVMGIVLEEEQITRILEEAERALSPYIGADGTVSFETSAHIVLATRA